MSFSSRHDGGLTAAKVEDCIRRCGECSYPFFTGFLTPEEYEIAENTAKKNSFCSYFLYGGFEDAQRCMFGAFPDFMEPEPGAFPIIPLAFSYPAAYNLSHRDFLGALMGAGLRREVIGDILTENGYAVVFVKEEISDYILTQVDQIGRVGVKIEAGTAVRLPKQQPPEVLAFTLASMRLDAVVAAVMNISREKSAKLIASRIVSVNRQTKDSVSMVLKAGDSLVIRGKGKFVIGSQIGLTKKGRVKLDILQYR